MQAKSAVALIIAVTCLALAPVLEAHGQSRILGPVISSVAPRTPAPSTEPQMLTITGSNFLAGVLLNVAAPDGRKVTYSGAAIRERRDTSFQVAVVLAAAGAYTLTATNPDGATSDQFVVKVQSSAPSASASAPPKVDRVLPELITKDQQPQVLKINGERFVPGLSVSLTDPIGTVYLLKGPAIAGVTATSFDLSVALEMTGEYALMVTNPSGTSSNSVNFKVVMRTGVRR